MAATCSSQTNNPTILLKSNEHKEQHRFYSSTKIKTIKNTIQLYQKYILVLLKWKVPIGSVLLYKCFTHLYSTVNISKSLSKVTSVFKTQNLFSYISFDIIWSYEGFVMSPNLHNSLVFLRTELKKGDHHDNIYQVWHAQ